MNLSPVVEYKKPLRISTERQYGKADLARKTYMREEDVRYLLSGRVMVEEKMDGRFCRLEHERFTVFAEDLKQQYSIRYRVPARYAIFDIYDKKRGFYLSNEGKVEVYKDMKRMHNFFKTINNFNFFIVPLVAIGNFTLQDLVGMLALPSSYAVGTGKIAHMEGVVIKPDRALHPVEQLFGQIVRKEFTEGIEVNYPRLPTQFNIIDPRVAEMERGILQ